MKVFLWINNKEFLKVRFKIASLIAAAIFFVSGMASQVVAADLTLTVHMASQRFHIAEDLIWRVIEVESGFDARATSRIDARGLMQITRPTWEWICRDYLAQDWSFDACAFDAEKNIIVGTRFLRWICDYLDGHRHELKGQKIHLVLACYNAGPGAVRRHRFSVPPFPETRQYLEKILRMPMSLPSGYPSVFTNNPVY